VTFEQHDDSLRRVTLEWLDVFSGRACGNRSFFYAANTIAWKTMSWANTGFAAASDLEAEANRGGRKELIA